MNNFNKLFEFDSHNCINNSVDHVDIDSGTNVNTNTDSNVNVNTDSNVYADVNTDANTNSHINTESNHGNLINFGYTDILLTLTINKVPYKKGVIDLIAKIFIVREIQVVDLNNLADVLGGMKIDVLNIISISKYHEDREPIAISFKGSCHIKYIELGFEKFKNEIKVPNFKFLKFNKNTLYIIRDSNYLDVKNLFTEVSGVKVNVGRGGSQKSHILSGLDFRLACYLMAMFDFNFKLISYLNTFNDLSKDRYLPYNEKAYVFKSINENNSLTNNLNNSLNKQSFLSNNALIGRNVSSLDLAKAQQTDMTLPNYKKEYHTSSIVKSKDNINNNSNSNINSNNSAVFSYLDQIDEIIEKNKSLYEAQEQIETSWISLMKKKLEDPNISTWRMLPELLKKAVNTLEKHDSKGILKRRFKIFSHELSSHKYEIILLTITMLISNYNKMSATNISIQIGNNIAFLLFKQNLIYDKSTNNHDKFESWKREHRLDSSVNLLRLGNYFVNLFTNEPTALFEFGLDEDDLIETNSDTILKISSEYVDVIKDTLLVHPTSLPMICEPAKWSDKSYGGFLENKYNQDPINTGSSYHGHKIEKKDALYNSVNILNRVKFNVNKDLLNYLLNEGNYLLIDEESEKRSIQNSITLKVANIYSKYTFYLNVNSDWRGRLYTNSFFLTYQGGDLSRSLIEFAEGQKLNEEGLKYLYIFTANCYSDLLSKKSFTQRIAWVKANYSKIIKLDKDFINNANKKIQFVSLCIVIKNYEDDNNYLVKLPVFLDATCSGIQHLAAMLQDVNLGAQVNLLSRTENENVCDLYETMVGPVNAAINKFGKENVLHSSLSNVKLNRKIIKTPIMTQVYNVTTDGIYRQLIKKLKKEKVKHPTNKTKHGKAKYNTMYYLPLASPLGSKKKTKEILVPYIDVYKISEIIKDSSFNVYPCLRDIYNYFINSAKLMLNLNIPIVWFTPAGLEISQSYFLSETNKVKLSYFGNTRTSVIREWSTIIDKNKQNQSIVPNIIHSLDASHLINVINNGYSKNITPIISIHDCFGTHPNMMNKLANLIRSEFVLLYTQENFLKKYNEKVINSIKDNNFEIIEKDGNKYVEYYKIKKKKDGTKYTSNKRNFLLIPFIPKMGDLDLKQIIKATYLIN